MRKIVLWLILFLLYCVSAAVAQDCDKIVADYDGALHGREAQVEQAAQALINQGADVRIRLVGSTQNLDFDEKQYEKSCASWQSPSGGAKSTLIVLMASPVSHKMGIYYGAAWKSALDQHFNRIKQEMGPRFRDKDFAGGFIEAENRLAARLVASKDEALHPNQTVNQATDLSGLWTVMKWIVGLLGLGFGFGLIIWLLGSKRREREKISQAQQEGALYRTRCSALINDARARSETWAGSYLDRYTELSQSEKLNPDTPGLSLAEYETIREQWKDLYEAMYNTRLGSSMLEEEAKATVEPLPPVVRKKPKHYMDDDASVATSSQASSSVLSGNTFIAPVIVNEEHEERHSRKDDDDGDSSWHGGSPSSSWSGSSSDSDSGGGSSSWDSGSSSDSGGDSGGGSSDFGGGGSDSGSSGGSSDF